MKGPLEQELSPIRVLNVSGEEIPPFGVMKATDADKQNGEPYVEVNKPDGSGSNYLLNGAFAIGIGATGWGSVAWSKRALFNDSEGTPSIGDEWGPKSGQWSLSPTTSGFVFVGDITTNTGRVRLSSASTPRDELRCQFTSSVAAGSGSNTWPILICKTTPTPIPLPTGTPAVAEDPLYVADIHGIASDLSDGDWIRAIRNVGVDTYNSEQVNWECNLDGAGGGGGTPEVGCGLEYDGVTGDLIVDVDALAGQGIKAGDSSMYCDDTGEDAETYCCLYIDLGCGLQFNSVDSDIIEVDVNALAGKGLAVGTDTDDCVTASSHLTETTYCCLYVNIGCGLKYSADSPPKVEVDLDALAGSGLGLGSSSGDCTGVTGFDGSCDCLKVNVGCGLDIVADNVVVDNTDLAGDGLSAGDGCSLDVNLDPTYFEFNESNQITFVDGVHCDAIEKDSITCTLEQDAGGDLKLTINWDNCDGTSGSTSCTLSGTTSCS